MFNTRLTPAPVMVTPRPRHLVGSHIGDAPLKQKGPIGLHASLEAEGCRGRSIRRRIRKVASSRNVWPYAQYEYHGKPLFGTVGIDHTFYGSATPKMLAHYAAQLPGRLPGLRRGPGAFNSSHTPLLLTSNEVELFLVHAYSYPAQGPAAVG